MRPMISTIVITLLASLTSVSAEPGRFQCHATSISDFADDPVYRAEKRHALQAAQSFEADVRSGLVRSDSGDNEKWQVVERGDTQTDAVLMRQKYYKTLRIDEFISIIRWSGDSNDGFHFERSILDGMISGICTQTGK
jgi:hypothetical protein